MKCSSGSDVLCPDNLLTLPELHNGVLVNALKLRHRKDIMYTHSTSTPVDRCASSVCINDVHGDKPLDYYFRGIRKRQDRIVQNDDQIFVPSVETLSARQRRQNEALHPPNPHVRPATTPTTTTSTPISGSSASAAARAEDHSTASMSGIVDRVQLSNLILEAFGNAKTLRNDNSSRFGKLTEVQFSQSGQLVGMRTTPFLLERSRVVHCALEERVFHCFYQLAAGGSKELLAELRIRSARDFQLLGQGKCISLKASGVDDAVEFKESQPGLKFSDAERHTVWRVVAAVAHLQNVQFVDHASQFGKKSSEEAELDPGSVDTVTFVAKDLLRLPDPNSLLQALVESTSVVRGQGTIVRKLSTQKALDQRDSISKLLYSKLFLWLVDRINAATEYRHASTFEEENDAQEQTSDMSPKTWIALLDIFGFEDFPVNSFEQFCINLANESLQRHYTHHHFIRDMEDMKREGITTQRVSFVDNGPCVELLQGQKNSVISVLDDCSTLDLERGANNNPNTAFLGKLTQLHRPEYQTSGPKSGGKSVLDRNGSGVSEHGDQGPAMEKPQDYFFRGRLDDDSFTIRHYACDVKYKVDGFVEKNMDHVRESSLTTLKTTTDEVLQSVFDVDENIGLLQDLQTAPASPKSRGGAGSAAGGPVGGRRSTVASQFRASLKLLMDTLDQSHPHWVRCIRPHVRKAPDLFDGKLVLEQLVATGILATIEQRQRNFPYRIPHGEFLQRFGVLAATSLRRLSSRSSNQERCNAIISALRIQSSSASSDPSSPSPSPNRHVNAIGDDANIQAGHCKMFLSSTVMLQLEKQREVLLDQHVMCVSAFVRTFTARKVMVKIIWTLHAIRMQRAARRTLRIRRCVNAYYAELRQRIVDRHLQEQRDLIQVESRARPRVLAEEQAEFFDTAKHFRALLGPMITTVLKNVRAVEATTRHELGEHLQQAYWKLEAFFAEGVAKAHELRSQRLKEERERRQHMMEVFWAQNVEGRSRIVEIEAKERH
ncbi:myosin heavy chain, putative, partial [Bodo saltans]